MQYGVCCSSMEMAESAATSGYDFIEWTVGGSLQPMEEDVSFAAKLQELKAMKLPSQAVNCFIPASLPVVGTEVDAAGLAQYVETVFARAAAAGVQCVVFGSGKARMIPADFDREQGRRQLLEFCRMVAPKAAAKGVVVVLEPLNRKECNVMNSVRECAEMVLQVDHPAVRLLADSYHVAQDGDSIEDVAEFANLLAHVHVATGEHRLSPASESCPVLEKFMVALRHGGYDGRVSIEAKIADADQELGLALQHLRRLGG